MFPLDALISEAEMGDGGAMLIVGFLYQHGFLLPRDSNMAIEWYCKAANNGLNVASYLISTLCDYSDKIESEKAIEYISLAAKKDVVVANHALGIIFEEGKACEKDLRKSEAFYRKAAERGYAPSAYRIAYLYETGAFLGGGQKEALEWYERAAELGEYRGALWLGTKFRNGDGVRKDTAKAVAWYERAAKMDSFEAHQMLSMIFMNGADGLPADEVRMAMHAQEAARLFELKQRLRSEKKIRR
jgi:TPR repeat protein